MKKLLLLLTVFTLLFISCEEEEDENASIEGTWLLTSKTENGEEVALNDCELLSTAVFSVSTFSITYYYEEFIFSEEFLIERTGECITNGTITGTYNMGGDSSTINFSIDEENYIETITYDVSRNTLTFRGSESFTYYDNYLEEEITESRTWTEIFTGQ